MEVMWPMKKYLVALFVMLKSLLSPLFAPRSLRSEAGGVSGPFLLIIYGVLAMVFGLSMAGTVITAVINAAGTTGAGSFTNALSLNDLFPFIYYTVLLVGSTGLIAVGGWKFAKGGG